jgi:hypothetical protein
MKGEFMKVVSLFVFVLLVSLAAQSQAQTQIRCQDFFHQDYFRGMEFFTVPDTKADSIYVRKLMGRLHFQWEYQNTFTLIDSSNIETYHRVNFEDFRHQEVIVSKMTILDEIPNNFHVTFKNNTSPRHEPCVCTFEVNKNGQKYPKCGVN